MTIRTFGGFRSGDEFFYGELRGNEVHRLSQPYWIQVQPTGEVLPLANLQIDVPVAPSKLIAVGLNYADHIAEMKRTEIGAPLIWFKAPSSLLAHHGVIEVAFTEHQTDFEVELAVVDRLAHEECQRGRCAPITFSVTRSASISPIAICKNRRSNLVAANRSTTYTPIGPFVYANVDVRDVSIKLWQNGELRQSTRTSRMIHSVAQIISFVSQSLTLLPGDVILTGTPAGVGPIRAGDQLEAEIDDWPRLCNSVAIAQEFSD